MIHVARRFVFGLLSLFASLPAQDAGAAPAIVTEVIDYRDGDTALQGYLAVPVNAKAAPAIMVVHEWKGHGDYARHRAEMLARAGYVALACDMYGKGVFAKDHDEAGKLAGVFFQDRSKMRTRAAAGLDVLRARPEVDKDRLFVMGYCFGGTTSLECARAGMPGVRGVASFHGNLTSPQPAAAGAVAAKVIVFHGADDAWVNPGLPGFEKEMREAKADWQLVSFGGAVHSFTVKEAGNDKSQGMAYDAKADARSWSMLLAFLAECLAK
ncbi:MAG: dienelactone hydrolase family protein [Planctomycetes bacterium]|nr:dienelactone hydrolase family protein [Planctomycetota bacterium]